MLMTYQLLILKHIQRKTLFYVDLNASGVQLIDLVTLNFKIT